MKSWLSDGGLGILGVGEGVCLMSCHPVRGADQGNRSPRGGHRFGPVGVGYISGGNVNQHSPLSSGVKLALCEEGRGWCRFV